MPITGVPTTRVSELLVAQRMLSQLRSDQADLFKLQNQISTGRRIELPSDDAPAALRAIGLQRLMERKQQSVVNLKTSQSFLGATDTALAQVSQILAEVRGTAVSVADTTSTDEQRAAAALEVRRSIDQLLDAGNQNFRGRYLFAGSQTSVAPFTKTGQFIQYSGNEQALQSFADVDLLFDTNATGHEVFGALSEPVRGSVDVNPILTNSTQLADLHGGLGVRPGSVEISDGTNTRIVDLSQAHTLGDVVGLLEANPPAGRSLSVSLTASGLVVALDGAGGGQLNIREVGGGTTANDLGILQTGNLVGTSVVGGDLDPRLTLATSLADILGVRASAVVSMLGANNDLRVEAAKRGPEFNGAAIQFVDDRKLQAGVGIALGGELAEFSKTARAARTALTFGGTDNDLILTANKAGIDFNDVTVAIASDVTAGNPATANYNAATKTLTLHLEDDGSTTAAEIVQAIANESSGVFTATLDTSVETTNTGAGAAGVINNSTFASTAHSGGAANTLYVYVQADTTATEAAAAIDLEGTFRATIEGHDSLSPTQAGTGQIAVDATAVTAGGAGVEFDQADGLQITNGGKTQTIDLSSAKTVEDFLNLLNGSNSGLVASLNAASNGIDVRSRLSGGDFAIGENGGQTATQLGLRTFDVSSPLSGLNHGLGIHLTDGPDFTIKRKDGVELAIDLDGAATIGDVLDRINQNPNNLASGVPVVARLVDSGNGIELLNDDPTGTGTLRVIPAVQGQAAQDLGLVSLGADESADPIPGLPATASVPLAGANNDLTLASAHPGAVFNDIQVRIVNVAAVGDQALVNYDANAKVLTLDVDPAATKASTLASAINAQGLFTAQLDPTGDPANDGSGLVTTTGTVATTAGGRAETLRAGDVNPQETAGVFNTLLKLASALESNDVLQIERTVGLLDEDQKRLSFSRAEVGARQQGLDTLQTRLDQEQVELSDTLSGEIDVDMVTAISQITARQASFEAALRSSAVMSGLSLLKFL
ncbi:MAG: flagellar hook-associated protein FlgL [Pirellulales bacterium]